MVPHRVLDQQPDSGIALTERLCDGTVLSPFFFLDHPEDGGVGQACNTLRRWVKPNKPIPTNPVKNRTTVEGSGTAEGGPPPFVTGSVDPVILERPTRYCHPGHNRNPAISKDCGLRPNQQTSHPLVEKRVKDFVPNFDLLIVHAFTIA